MSDGDEDRPSHTGRQRRMKRILVALALGVGIAGCATFFAIRRFNEGPMQLARGGVTMRVVETEERAPRRLGLVAARGDVLIESDALRVVIAGGGRPDAPLGAVLEASLANGEGLARGATLLPVLTDGTREYPIVFEAFRIVERGDAGERVALHLTGAAQVDEQVVRVTVEAADAELLEQVLDRLTAAVRAAA